jgi:hypothetical protein
MRKKIKKRKIIIVALILVIILILLELLLMNFFEFKTPIFQFVIILILCILVVCMVINPNKIFVVEQKEDLSQKLGFITDSNINLELMKKENLRGILKTNLKCLKNDEVTIVFYAKKVTESCHLYVDYSSYECEEFKFKNILAKKINDKTYVFRIKPSSKGIFCIQAVQYNKGIEIKNNQEIILTVKARY